MLKVFKDEVEKGFKDWFENEVLNGRPTLIADTTTRTYPYLHLVSAYTHGLTVAGQIVDKMMSEKGNDDEV